MASQMVEAHVCRHSPDPGPERPILIEGPQPLVASDEGVLGQVFGFPALAKQAVTHIEDRGLVPSDKLPVGFDVPVPGLEDEGPVS